MIDVVTNIRCEMIKLAGKTGGIDVSHFEEVLVDSADSSWEGN